MDVVRIADSIDAAQERLSIQNRLRRSDYACPMCGAHMLLRTVISDTAAERTQFWGCATYSACKGTLREEQGDLGHCGY